MNTSLNLALRPTIENGTVAAIQNALDIDPREQIVSALEEQNQSLLQGMEKAVEVFQKNKEEKDKTIATLAKSNEELNAALIASESRNKELVMLHEAAMKALRDNQQQQIKILNEESQKILTLCNDVELYLKNVPIICDYKSIIEYVDCGEYQDVTSASWTANSGVYSGSFSQIASAINQKLDNHYKNRGRESMNLFTKEAAVKLAQAKSKLQTIKSEFEKK